jgi:hypothetical protein
VVWITGRVVRKLIENENTWWNPRIGLDEAETFLNNVLIAAKTSGWGEDEFETYFKSTDENKD